jgi:hypothetical protein
MRAEPMSIEEVASIAREARQVEDDGLGGKSPLMREMVANWKEFSPQMYERLEKADVLWDYAMVLEIRYHKEVIAAAGRGMNPSDAEREYAGMLMMSGGEDEEED